MNVIYRTIQNSISDLECTLKKNTHKSISMKDVDAYAHIDADDRSYDWSYIENAVSRKTVELELDVLTRLHKNIIHEVYASIASADDKDILDCYLVNFEDCYMCHRFNGTCNNIDRCRNLREKEKSAGTWLFKE